MSTRRALISLSAFKGYLTNQQACEIVANQLKKLNFETQAVPIGDGGRGTLDAVQQQLGGEKLTLMGEDPLNAKIQCQILALPDANNPKAVYVESAESCGMHLVAPERMNSLRASSHGLGLMLKEILSRWEESLKTLYIGLGDSAVSDAGMGMLSALGFEFLDQGGQSLWGNADSLRQIHQIKHPPNKPWKSLEIVVLCDVMNPLCGPDGSARTFSPQKGAKTGQVAKIEQGMEWFAKLVEQDTGRSIGKDPMTGAAGGISAALFAFLNAKLVRGAQFFLDWIHFDKTLSNYDFVITGEGSTDSQTLAGKAPFELIQRAGFLGKKSVLISGELKSGIDSIRNNPYVAGCFQCGNSPTAEKALTETVDEIFCNSEFLDTLV